MPAVSQLHTSNGRIPLTKDPKENGYKPLPRRGVCTEIPLGKKLIASATKAATTPPRHSERSEESLCGFSSARLAKGVPHILSPARRYPGSSFRTQ
jgi:hypothetical protein